MNTPHQPPSPPAARRRVSMNDDDFFGPQPTPTAELPEHNKVLCYLAIAAVEIDEGARGLDQLGNVVDEKVYRFLQGRLAYQQRARAQARGASTHLRPQVVVGRIHSRSPRDGVLEATVMVTYNEMTRAVAVRLEGWDHRWRATELHII